MENLGYHVIIYIYIYENCHVMTGDEWLARVPWVPLRKVQQQNELILKDLVTRRNGSPLVTVIAA